MRKKTEKHHKHEAIKRTRKPSEAGLRSPDGSCLRCRSAPPHYVAYPVCLPCWADICRIRKDCR